MSFDMTRGKPAGLMVRFALPLILSAIVQQLYTLCDSVIVGRLLGENAFASVGGAAFLHGIPLSILLGGTQGFGVAIGQRFGAKDGAGLTRFFSAAGILTLSVSLALSGLGLGFLKPLLALMKTPDQLVSNSALYLTVQVGAASLRVRSAFVAAMYLLCAWRAAISGMGNALIPMVSGFMELGLKTAAIVILPSLLGLTGLYLMDAAAWLPVAAFLGISYHRVLRNRLAAEK